MSCLSKFVIRLYWLIPKRFRRDCLYKESCSKHVYRIISEEGFSKGIRALKHRINTCQPHYKLIDVDGQRTLIHQNGHSIQSNQLADWLKK